MTIVLITDGTTRAELAVTLGFLNAEAKAYTRRGYTGTRSADYEVWHERINSVLTDWEKAK